MMDRIYKCVESFKVCAYTDNGCPTGNMKEVVVGGVWYLVNDGYSIIGGEIRLESEDLGWLEIPKEMFEECFVEVEQ